MKLYDVPRDSRIRIKGLEVNGILTEELNFHNIDGMYSYCTTDDELVVHLSASTEVELINKDKNE